jgi:hypothetical protein
LLLPGVEWLCAVVIRVLVGELIDNGEAHGGDAIDVDNTFRSQNLWEELGFCMDPHEVTEDVGHLSGIDCLGLDHGGR